MSAITAAATGTATTLLRVAALRRAGTTRLEPTTRLGKTLLEPLVLAHAWLLSLLQEAAMKGAGADRELL